MSRLAFSTFSLFGYGRGLKGPSAESCRPLSVICCAGPACLPEQLTRYQSVCSDRSPPLLDTRFTATEKSQTGRPVGVMRISGSRPTLPMIWILAIDAIGFFLYLSRLDGGRCAA